MATASICYLAQSEGDSDSKCVNCFGKNLITLIADSDTYSDTFYPAPYEFAGRTMTTYAVDGMPGPYITQGFLDNLLENGGKKVYPIPVDSEGFSELCVFYDLEGGARINVAAAISGVIVHPKGAGAADGTDENCPIESAELSGSEYPLQAFVWAGGQITKQNKPSNLNGAWTTEPAAGEGTMVLQAKAELPVDKFFMRCRFLHWEFNRLTATKDKALLKADLDRTIKFDRNIYAGLIAHYKVEPFKLLSGGGIHEPTTKPGEISACFPPPAIFVVIGERRVAYEVRRLAEGSIRPIRNDPRSAAHGSVLREPRIARDLRARIVGAARTATDSQHELQELLRQVPPGDPRSAAQGSVPREPRIARDLRVRILRAARTATDSQHELQELLRQVSPAAE